MNKTTTRYIAMVSDADYSEKINFINLDIVTEHGMSSNEKDLLARKLAEDFAEGREIRDVVSLVELEKIVEFATNQPADYSNA